jgi:protein-S-isoprenylcysteine O-methyltransferase Ste14
VFWRLLKTAIFTVIAPFTIGVWLPYRFHQWYGKGSEKLISQPAASLAISLAFLLVGASLYFWCAWDFVSKGLGTPAPIDAPKKLVIRGAYRFVRNPMYVGVCMIILSQAVVWRSKEILVYLIFVVACFHLFVLGYEEPHLRKVFGTEYTNYCHGVRRWLPRLRPIA